MLDSLLKGLPLREVSDKLEDRMLDDSSLHLKNCSYKPWDGIFKASVEDSEGKIARVEVHRNFPIWDVKIYGEEDSYAFKRIKGHVEKVCAGRECFPVYLNEVYHGAIPYSQNEIRKLSRFTA